MCEPKETCENCKYSRVGYRFTYAIYGGLKSRDMLECHFNPPTGNNTWPEVTENSWCGEYEKQYEDSCAFCKYGHHSMVYAGYECRVGPPTSRDTWPKVSKNSLCGAFERWSGRFDKV